LFVNYSPGPLIPSVLPVYYTLKMAVFWDIAPFCLVVNDRRFTWVHCLCQQGDVPYCRSESTVDSTCTTEHTIVNTVIAEPAISTYMMLHKINHSMLFL